MGRGLRYGIQRYDLLWYAGEQKSGVQWVTRAREAHKFLSAAEARTVAAQLQEQGHRVFILGV